MNPKVAVRLGTSCKDWTAAAAAVDPTKRKAPWLLAMTSSDTTCMLQSVTDQKVWFKIQIHGFVLRRYHFGGSWNGWVVLQPYRRGQISLLNPFSRARWDLPVLPRGGLPSRSFFYMSSAPTTVGCVLCVRKLTMLYVWSPGRGYWTAEQVEAKEFKSIVSVEGQFYAMNERGSLISFQVFPLRFRELDVPRPPVSNDDYHHERFLVESCGELLYVVIAGRDSTKICVFRLDLRNREWVKTTRLGDRAIFLHWKQGISVSAGEAGCRGNCVYYTRQYDDSNVWRVYDLEKQSFTRFRRRDCPQRMFHENSSRGSKRDQVAAREQQQMAAEALAASTIDDILANEAFAELAYTLAAGMKPTSEARDQPDLPLLLDRRCHNPPRRPRDE
ncbi:hypothetical protein B296_00045831 [Ensete ventricosum]|uniref:KIB1-4 beta-propeller domain-containing protein n=1 Tax=Ensete ventricosum TaxID=4639 RepID=A0A426YNF5_ENSVE|nr:hypothetical protein B296_00045831 [Ensete ventricosum]